MVSAAATAANAQEAAPDNDVAALAAQAPVPAPSQAIERPNINPYDRDIAMTVPLHFNRRVLGELDVLLTRDDRFRVYSATFKALLDPLLTPEARLELEQVLAGREMFEAEDIAHSGIALNYDPDLLAVLVLRIDPTKRAVEDLYESVNPEAPGIDPEPFSAYLNTNIAVSKRYSESGVEDPMVGLSGAIRYKHLVFEADFVGDRRFSSDEYAVERQYARLVYDEPEAYRRWWVGDIDPEYRGRQSYVDLGGIGVARQRRRFDTFRSSILSGNRKIVLQEDATVRVSRNGIFQREFRLDAGQYDLSNLPLEFGSNNLQIEILGPTGRIETVNYSAYLDAIDLEPGDYEYAAYFGKTNTNFFGSPDYSDGEWVFSGYWQKAFETRPAIGLGLQASENVQILTGQTQFILMNGSRLRFDAAASDSPVGTGYAGMVVYEHFVDRGERIDAWSVAIDYTSAHFGAIGNLNPYNSTEWTVSTSYSRQLSVDWGVTVAASYQTTRDVDARDAYSLNAYTTYQISRTVGLQFGATYSDYGIDTANDRQWGFTLGLVWQPRGDRRVEARYASQDNSGSVRFTQASENRVGAWGYSVGGYYADGPANVSGTVNYVGNRFDAAVSHAAYGENFSNVTDEHVSSVRVGSALAFAGGKFAVSRPIYDSFALVQAHDTLGGRKTIIGDNFERGTYMGRSGALGPAVANTLASYVNQTVYYDVMDVPPGYDVGEGLRRVYPSYRSGYLVTAGSDAFVSVMGRLVGRSGGPISLMSGRLSDVAEPDARPEVFFTNSVGRFAAQKPKPGHTYRVELFTSPPESFEFTIPEDNEGLYDLQSVRLSTLDPEQ